MQAYAVSYSKYMIAASMVLYTFLAYVALPSGKDVRRTCETLQRLCLGVFTINAYLTMAILAGDEYIFTFGILQLLIVLGASLLYRTLYKSANMLMINNIMMLLSIGLVMITRINQAKAQKQLLISLVGMVFLMVIPLLRSKFDSLRKGTYFYGILGIAALGAVLLLGAITNGSKISFTIAGMTFQPSEFVKILFILFMASALCEENSKSHIAILTAAALAHVGILVLSRDLGSALIFFVIYLALLFLSTGNWNILAGGLLLGLITAVICFFLFLLTETAIRSHRPCSPSASEDCSERDSCRECLPVSPLWNLTSFSRRSWRKWGSCSASAWCFCASIFLRISSCLREVIPISSTDYIPSGLLSRSFSRLF